MAKRKKRAVKSIKSLETQIIKHEEKRAKSKIPELRGYYDKEIRHLKDELAKKKRIAKK
ncbi:MAG: hypothetical protein U9Q22_00935 [Candidatus Altiarchaeota archaeon]|nr:hypothetical protein [Candidatus Altiarchaeota archaeon]